MLLVVEVEEEETELQGCWRPSSPPAGVCGWARACSLEDSVVEVMIPAKKKRVTTLHLVCLVCLCHTLFFFVQPGAYIPHNATSEMRDLHTQCAGGGCRVLLQGLVDVDSVWRQGSSQCGQTTSH